jgi:hypothetical protein
MVEPTLGQLPTGGKLVPSVRPGSTGLPEALLRVEFADSADGVLRPPFLGIRSRLLLYADLAQLRSATPDSRTSVWGEIELRYEGPDDVVFESDDGRRTDSIAIPFTVDVHRPVINVTTRDQVSDGRNLAAGAVVVDMVNVQYDGCLLELEKHLACSCGGQLAMTETVNQIAIRLGDQGSLGPEAGIIRLTHPNPDVAVVRDDNQPAQWTYAFRRTAIVDAGGELACGDDRHPARIPSDNKSDKSIGFVTIQPGTDFGLLEPGTRSVRIIERGPDGKAVAPDAQLLVFRTPTGDAVSSGAAISLPLAGEPTLTVFLRNGLTSGKAYEGSV